MTAQIPDKFIYEGKQYYFIDASNVFGFDPKEYDVRTMSFITSCWRGFYCEYKLEKNRLYLDAITIAGGSKKFANQFAKYRIGSNDYGNIYKHIMCSMKYSGKILMGQDFVDEYYLHGGFQCAAAYREVIELTLVDGKLVKVTDFSDYVEKKRDVLFRYAIYGYERAEESLWHSIKSILGFGHTRYWWE